jgi:hypothetical protein
MLGQQKFTYLIPGFLKGLPSVFNHIVGLQFYSLSLSLLFYVKPKNSCNLLQFLSSIILVCPAVCVIIHTAKSRAQQKGRADVSRHSNQGMLSSPYRESVLRIRNQSSGSGLKFVSDPDSNLNSNPDFAGLGSGSISKRHGSADPDPCQYVTDPQQCVQLLVNVKYV